MKNRAIFADIKVKGGVMVLTGVVVEETEKAVKIDYALESIYSAGKAIAERSAWVPKSQIINGEHSLTISNWFANKAMKSIRINPYSLGF